MTLSNSHPASYQIPNIWERQLRIKSSALRMGHYVAKMDVSWEESPFAFQGVLLTEQQQIGWMKSRCDWVVVDLQRSQVKKTLSKVKKHVARPLSVAGKTISCSSMKSALKAYVGLEREVSLIISSLRSGQFISTEKMKESINGIADQLFDHGPALVWLTHIKSKDNYTAEHCLNVAILAMGLAHSLGWKENEIREAGLAGLLHDVGKTRVDHNILNKPGPLTEAEFEIMKAHTDEGFNLLSTDAELSPAIKDAAHHHHERPDGSGYPHALGGHQISRIAGLISVVDAYDAITSDRCYQKVRNHHLALSILWKGRGTQFSTAMVEAFIHWIGWVSPGTIVKLTSGETAVVIMANSGSRLQPTVRIIAHTIDGQSLGPVQELSAIRTGDDEKIFIEKVLTASEEKINIKNLARQMMFDKS